MTDDEFTAACDEIMAALVDAGCGGCAVSATVGLRDCDVTLWNGDVRIVADLLAAGLAARQRGIPGGGVVA